MVLWSNNAKKQPGMLIPFGTLVKFLPSKNQNQRKQKMQPKAVEGVFLGFKPVVGGKCGSVALVARLTEFALMNMRTGKRTRTNDAGQLGDGGKPTIQQIPTKEITPVVPPAYPLRETYDKTFQTLSGVEDDITTDFDDASFDLGGEDEEDKEAPGAQSREK